MNTIDSRELAYKHAIELKEKYSLFFKKNIGLKKLKLFASHRNITIINISNSPIQGRLEIKLGGDLIFLNSDLPLKTRIKILGHEIGHWVLHSYYPELEKHQSLAWIEEYADFFSEELITPIKT